MLPFFISIPHSGEQVPPEATWLQSVKPETLLCDVDRFVDDLYRPAIETLKIPHVLTKWHRYAVDLNRLVEDVDSGSVEGNMNPLGSFPLGLHWQKTTKNDILMESPISEDLHQLLIEKYYSPFHSEVENQFNVLQTQGDKSVYHLDLHSMPSVGTENHKDPGETRAEIVVSDVNGTSCEKKYSELVLEAYEKAGFKVAYNWPYQGGRITQKFGRPDAGHHTVQVEMSRAIYMEESGNRQKTMHFSEVQNKLQAAISHIVTKLKNE